MTAAHRERTVATLGAWIPRGADVAIVDVPVHRNVGDLFILAAATRLLADLGCRIVHRAGVRDYRTSLAKRHVGKDTVLIGLGGGNFGDVYPRYQDLRERIVRDFPGNRIIILPQTIHFGDPHRRDRAIQRLRTHGNLRIAVRDSASLQIAREITKDAELLPDIVHALCGRARPEGRACSSPSSRQLPGTGGRGTVVLMRRDKEGSNARVDPNQTCIDWPHIFPDFIRRLAMTAALMQYAPRWCSSGLHDAWSAYATELLSRGLAWMSSVDHLVTDRLHAAILARLAGRPVTLHDHAYGKLTAYYDAWWREDSLVQLRTPLTSLI